MDKKVQPYRNTDLGYPVVIGEDLGEDILEYLVRIAGKDRDIYVLTDDNTRHLCFPNIEKALGGNFNLNNLSVKPGEMSKSVSTCNRVWDWLSRNGADRNSLLLNLGGGVISDLGGFAAATYRRGIRHVNLPTSLLAQADAAIGGKVALNFNGIKNHLGLFKDPVAVICDLSFMNTLTDREKRSGLGEIMKSALLGGEERWKGLLESAGKYNWPELVTMSVDYKIGVVRDDPFESGLRKVLNFGHTVGHAFESFSMSMKEVRFSHGESVAAGIISESYISTELLGLRKELLSEINDFVHDQFPSLFVNNDDVGHILELARSDKKNMDGAFRMSLLRSAGDPVYGQDCPKELVRRSIQYYIKSCSK